MWNWTHLGIFFALSLLVCLCGFKKYVYFMSIGYGFSVAIIGVAMAVLGITGAYGALTVAHYLQFALFFIYGFRLSGFLLIREIKTPPTERPWRKQPARKFRFSSSSSCG